MGVRRESVELSLNDAGFSTGVAKAAAATALLNHELGNLDGNSVRANRSTATLGDGNGGIAKTGTAARKSSADIDKYSGRLGLLAKSALALGPALVPISVAAIPAISGLTMGFGAAAGAAGVALLAFNGVGDAVKAMDAYALQPTAANLQKMQQAMQDLGPAGANFARFIDGLEPQLRALQGSAREGLLPGVQQGIEELLPLLPKVQDFVGRIGSEMGNLAAEAGKGLTGDAGIQKFAHYIDTEGVPIMDAFAKTTGKVASGLVALAADMAPLTGDFMGGMEHAADSFQKWAEGLDQTQGFRDFVAYVEQEGPQVVDLLKTVASTGLSIAEAFAPIGSATLPALTAVAKVIGLIADSPLGPVVATVISLNAAIGLGTLAVDKLAASWGRVAVAAGGAAEAETAAAAAAGGGGLLAGLTGKLGTAAGTAVTIGAGAWATSALMSKLTHAQVDPSKGITSGAASKLAGNIDLATSPRGYLGPISNIGAWVDDRLPGKDAYQAAQSNLSDTDLLLSQMASSGQGDKAAAAFAKISKAAKDSGVSVSQVAAAFPHYTAAVKDADAASKSDSDSTTKLASSTKGLSAQFSEGTISMSQYRAGLAALHSQALTDFDAVTQFGSAVQAAARQAKDGARQGLNPFTEAGNANRVAVSGMVAAWNAQPAAIQNNVKQYQQMKSKLVEFMTQMGATKAQIADFTRQINQPKKLVVTAETAQARSALADIIAMAQSVPRTLRTDYIVNQINSVSKPKVNMPGSADGSTVPKDGGPYADRYPYLLAPGEEVITNRNGQADRWRPLLKAINAGRLADGGTARPLFHGEGPRFYNAAYAHNSPFAVKGPAGWDWPYQTPLTRSQERLFEAWVNSAHVPFDMGSRLTDYDMRGYWLKTKGRGWHEGSHFPDTFKTPYDTTFSHESKYATKNNPFYWHGDKLVDQRNGQVVFAANGGFITGAGGPRDDKIPAWLSNGEFVVNAATTARLRPLLERENAKGFANGGLVGGDFSYGIGSVSASGSSSSSSSSSSKSKDEETKAEKKAAEEHAKTAKAAAALTASLIHLHKTVDPQAAKQAKGMFSSLNHASKIVDNTFGEFDRVGKRWDGWTDKELNTIKAADKATIALNKMQVSTFKQIKAYDKAADKAAEREKDALTVAKSHAQAVRDDIASIKDSIASRYRSDVFGNVDSSSLAYQIDPKTGKYVDAKQSSVLQLGGITAGLQKDIADAQAAKAAEASIAAALKKQGFGKDKINAYTLDLEQHASVGVMQALAANPTIAGQQAQLYAVRQSVSAATGQALASQIDSQALAAANKTVDLLQKAYNTAESRAKKADARYKRLEAKHDDLRNYVKNHLAKDTGKATSDGVNTASKKGK